VKTSETDSSGGALSSLAIRPRHLGPYRQVGGPERRGGGHWPCNKPSISPGLGAGGARLRSDRGGGPTSVGWRGLAQTTPPHEPEWNERAASLSPREERVGREPERGAAQSTQPLLSPTLSSLLRREAREKPPPSGSWVPSAKFRFGAFSPRLASTLAPPVPPASRLRGQSALPRGRAARP